MVVSIESPNLSLKFILGGSPSTTKHDVVRASICCVTHPGMYKKCKYCTIETQQENQGSSRAVKVCFGFLL